MIEYRSYRQERVAFKLGQLIHCRSRVVKHHIIRMHSVMGINTEMAMANWVQYWLCS